jgi:hypothetical protein
MMRWVFGLVSMLACAALAEDAPATTKAFDAGSIEEQLAKDMTPVPSGMGAIFVPSLSSPSLEPRVVVLRDGKRIASGKTGTRLLVPPGQYDVVVGAGAKEGRAQKSVRVGMAETAIVGDFFGGLRIQIVDAEDRPLNLEYTIGRHGSPLAYPSTSASDAPEYDKTPTWLLPQGLYTVSLGGRAGADEDSFTVSLHAGELLRYKLTVDDDHLVKSEVSDKIIEPSVKVFTGRLVVGGDASGTQSQGQPAALDLTAVRLGGFANAQFGIDYGDHLAVARVGLDQSWAWVFDQDETYTPFNKIFDDARVELLYNYRLFRIFGPYVRAMGNGAIFPTWRNYNEAKSLRITDSAGVTEARNLDAGETLTLAGWGGMLTGQGSAGIGVTLVDIPVVTLLLRVGAAGRYGLYQGNVIVENENNDVINLKRLDNAMYLGAEATAVGGLRLGKVLSYETTFDAFSPYQQLLFQDGVAGFRPMFRWDNTVALKLSNFFDVFYRATVWNWDLQATQLALYQGVGLRISTNLF